MESIFESYELYDWNKIQSKIEKYIESKPLLRKCLLDFEKDLKSYMSCAKKRSTLNNIAAIDPIRDLSRFSSLDEALLSTWKVYKLLPNKGIRNEAVKKQLFDAVNKTLSLPENVLNHLKESPYANYVFLELIRKSQVFKYGYEIENDEIDDEEIDDDEVENEE